MTETRITIPEIEEEITELGPNDLLLVRDVESGTDKRLSAGNLVNQVYSRESQIFVGGVDYTVGVTTTLTVSASPLKTGSIIAFGDGSFISTADYTVTELSPQDVVFDSPISFSEIELIYDVGRSNLELDQAVADAELFRDQSENFSIASENSQLASEIAASQSSSSATSASSSATSASSSATSASASAAAAVAAAAASGNVVFYDTYALANAAVGSLPDLQVVHVFVDETRLSQRTAYRKEGGVLVFKTVLDKFQRRVYVDSILGNDSNDGATPDTPKLTLAAAVALCAPFTELLLASGSRFFERLDVSTITDLTVGSYGLGRKPIIDMSRLIPSGSWLPDPDHANVYYADVTHDFETAQGVILSNNCQFAIWEENDSINRYLTPKYDGATIADNRAFVAANPGTFTVHKQGSTVANAQLDGNSRFWRYYIQLTDSSDPTTGVIKTYHGEQAGVAAFGLRAKGKGLIFQRTSGKNMTGSSLFSDSMIDCEWYDAAVHAWVGPCGEIRNPVATARPPSKLYGGGAYHFFYALSPTRGVRVESWRATGFANGVYFHGATETNNDTVHKRVDIKKGQAVDCNVGMQMAGTEQGVFVEDVTTVGCGGYITAAAGQTNIKRGKYVAPAAGGIVFNLFHTVASGALNLEDVEVIGSPTAETQLWANGLAQSLNSADIAVLNMTRVTAVNCRQPNNARRAQVNVTVADSSLGQLLTLLTDATRLFTNGTFVATNTQLAVGVRSIAEIQALAAGVNSNCIVPYVAQPYSKTIASTDVGYAASGRTASGTVGGDVVTMNFVDTYFLAGTQIRIADVDGAGTPYVGTITELIASGSSGSVRVTPVLPNTFATKAVEYGYFNKQIFPTVPGNCVISNDGTQIYVDNEDFFSVGQVIYLKALNRNSDLGVTAITNKSSKTLTVSPALSWQQNRIGQPTYNAFGATAGIKRPDFAVQFGWTLQNRNTYLSIDRAIGIADVVNTTEGASSNTSRFADATSMVRNLTAAGVNDTQNAVIKYEEGFIDLGLRVANGDVLTLNARAYIPQYDQPLITDPVRNKRCVFSPTSEVAKRGIGALQILSDVGDMR